MPRRAGLQFAGARAAALRWLVLIILSGVFALGLEVSRLPAALLLGPMIAAILCGVRRRRCACRTLPL